jgi:predicted GNAT superfamily acetyltransferase
MNEIIIRDAQGSDFQVIVDINAVEVEHTSPMTAGRLRELDALCSYHKVAEVEGKIAAFLFCMRENGAYENENYEWFSSRYSKFLYVDRIVVDANYSGLKIGTMLYQDLFDYARSDNVSTIACEYNVIPPNEPSRIFHAKLGFKEVGMQWLASREKSVSMQAAEI